MNLSNFINQFIEGYLFHDLVYMAKIKVRKNGKYGGVGYPMMATILSGMELLGSLLDPSRKNFNPLNGNHYFLNYWNNYFCASNPH